MLSDRTCSDIIKRHISCILLYIFRFVLWQHGFVQFFKMKKKLPIILLIIYLIALLMITIFRPWRGSYHFMGGTLNLTLFEGYGDIIRAGIPRFIYLFFGNIVWFVPLGFYLSFVKKASVLKALLFGFLLSLFIETTQYILGTGISEIDDLILNTFGSLVGWGISSCILGIVRKNKKI